MRPPANANPNAIVRVLLQNIEDGDRRKFIARSNDSDSGGGARDLRFRPESEFMPFFGRMFPNRSNHRRNSNGVATQITVFEGTVHWDEPNGNPSSANMEIWPSTNARPNECRIARISDFGLDGHILNDPNGGRSVFMMFQQANGTIKLYFTHETSLLSNAWDPQITDFARRWIDDGCKSAFLDLSTNQSYPNV